MAEEVNFLGVFIGGILTSAAIILLLRKEFMKFVILIIFGFLLIWALYLNFAPIKCPDYVSLMPPASYQQQLISKLCPESPIAY